MRIVIVADVHSNLEALQAVLADAGERGAIDAVWSLGDLVGYGPDPSACIELLQRHAYEAVNGNHDLAAIGAIGVEDFNPNAAEAARWTEQQLSAEQKLWLTDQPLVRQTGYEFTLVHGSLNDPVWEYMVFSDAAEAHLAQQSTPYGLVGHTHQPRVFYEGQPEATAEPEDGFELPLDGRRFVANPGSVGQPRDGDPRAAYAVVDSDSARLSFHRVEYDIAATQAKMREAGLPEALWRRLAVGR